MADEAVAALIRTHVQRYIAIDILDVYKLLHQGVFGPGHAVENLKAARERLEKECEKLAPAADEILVESVHPAGQIVRIHLRPYLAAQGNLKKLLEAFARSSRTPMGSLSQMAAWWAVFQAMTEPGNPLANRFTARTVSLVGRTRAAESWPASQHSPPYDRTHKPAYRVLTFSDAQDVLNSQRISYTLA